MQFLLWGLPAECSFFQDFPISWAFASSWCRQQWHSQEPQIVWPAVPACQYTEITFIHALALPPAIGCCFFVGLWWRAWMISCPDSASVIGWPRTLELLGWSFVSIPTASSLQYLTLLCFCERFWAVQSLATSPFSLFLPALIGFHFVTAKSWAPEISQRFPALPTEHQQEVLSSTFSFAPRIYYNHPFEACAKELVRWLFLELLVTVNCHICLHSAFKSF